LFSSCVLNHLGPLLSFLLCLRERGRPNVPKIFEVLVFLVLSLKLLLERLKFLQLPFVAAFLLNLKQKLSLQLKEVRLLVVDGEVAVGECLLEFGDGLFDGRCFAL
jgi:hypothetical protein